MVFLQFGVIKWRHLSIFDFFVPFLELMHKKCKQLIFKHVGMSIKVASINFDQLWGSK